ncbi:MAG: hypothetical protein ACW976_03070 [Candidatus Ranarchaeia archaeon]|jgi:hypothetical protein
MGFFDRLKEPKANIRIQLDQPFVSLREPMTGKLLLSSSEVFEADELRIEFWVSERVRATEQRKSGEQTITVTANQTSQLHRGKISVGGYTQFNEGFSQEIPFTAHLPANVPPTYRSRNVQTTWMIKGVIGVKGRPDVTTNQMEIQVTN